MDYSKLSDFEINKRIAELEGVRGFHCENVGGGSSLKFTNWKELDYCNNPADAWQIIHNNGISVSCFKNSMATAWDSHHGLAFGPIFNDPNPLRAAMIVFLMMQGE